MKGGTKQINQLPGLQFNKALPTGKKKSINGKIQVVDTAVSKK